MSRLDPIDLTALDDAENENPSVASVSPAKFMQGANGVLEILSDSEEEEDMNVKPKVKEVGSPVARRGMKREALSDVPAAASAQKKAVTTRKDPPTTTTITQLKDPPLSAAMNPEIEIVFPPVPLFAAASLPPQDMDDDDDEIQFAGATGKNALADFPHARENCVVARIEVNALTHCANCFCYVCDVLASACTTWAQHCHARHGNPHWKRLRQEAANGGVPAAATTTAAAAIQTLAASAPSHGTWRRRGVSLSSQELLNAITRVYPSETAPPTPLFHTNLRHYQKQSLSFMLDVERNESQKVGWLCSEVGMGKSAIVIALVATNPKQKTSSKTYKATLVMTSVSLIGQWEDECKKHAPGLIVRRYHGPSREKVTESQLRKADIIISSATIKWTPLREFHRVVMDESHLFGSSSAKLDHGLSKKGKRRWCVTATPLSSSVSDLLQQASFLDLQIPWNTSKDESLSLYKAHMIRHVKAQRINGSAALSLPSSTTETKILPMSPAEKKLYRNARQRIAGVIQSIRQKSALKSTYLDMRLHAPLVQPLMNVTSSKIQQLKADLQGLQQRDAGMRAVVFTQFLDQQRHIVNAVESMGLKVYSLQGSTAAKARDTSIRDFQSLDEKGPAVFVITMRAGSVGITLTAASHVFLIEPCINPATEVQAAGRIHRLGQTKQVGVTKYVYGDSFETNIKTLHEKLASGQVEITPRGLQKTALRVLLVGL
jgi:superfamily II DNA or RNA helicase